MTIASAITAAQGKVANAYTAVSNKGGTLPATQNLSNLPTAINSISTGGTISSLTITPTTSQQTITASGGTDGYSPITVNAVTSSIDSNISAVNIKKDVTILGVTGSYEGSGGGSSGIKANFVVLYDSSYGDMIAPVASRIILDTGSYVISINIAPTDLTNSIKPFQEATTRRSQSILLQSSYVKEIHLCALKTLVDSGGRKIFESCAKDNTTLTVADFSGLETIGGAAHFQYAFKNCTNLETLDFSNLISASTIGQFMCMIDGCTSLTTLSFPKLSTVSGNIFYGSAAAGGAFANSSLQTLSFPALTTTSGIASNTFNNMLKNVTGCTVHFPSNLQSTMSSWSSVISGFSGTNTTVLWDLPATS